MSKSFIVIIMSLDHFGRRECCVKYHLYQMKNRRLAGPKCASV